MQYSDAWKIESTFNEISQLFQTGIISSEHVGKPLFRAAFVQILILLRDLMAKAELHGQRISFSDHIEKNEKVTDVTDLIKYIRDAVCHLESPNHLIAKDRQWNATFNVVSGHGAAMRIGNFVLRCEFDDDMRIYFGSQGIYMRRHILRALQEAKEFFEPMLRQAKNETNV